MKAHRSGRQTAFSIQTSVRRLFVKVLLKNFMGNIPQTKTFCLKPRDNLTLRQYLIALISDGIDLSLCFLKPALKVGGKEHFAARIAMLSLIVQQSFPQDQFCFPLVPFDCKSGRDPFLFALPMLQ